MVNRVTWIAQVAVLCCVGLGGVARAEQFRVENRIFVGDEKEPRSESTTIFYDDVVYDFLVKPAEITIFDKTHDRFVLLDVPRRVKTEVPTAHVKEFAGRLKQWGSAQPDAMLKFLVDPRFEERNDAGEMVFSSPWLTYRVMTEDAGNEAVSRQYSEFSDWYSQLNTLLNPGTRPPFARMVVNAALEARQRFPREVHLTLRSKDSLLSRRITIRSEHQLISQLIQPDRERISQTDQYIAIFTPLKFDEYQKKIEK
jgi:hypothetical protein